VDALSHVAIASVPRMKRNTLKYWWWQEAMVFKQNAMESHRVWKYGNRPSSGPLFNAMKVCKYKYMLYLRNKKNRNS